MGVKETSSSKRMEVLLSEGAQWMQRGHLGEAGGVAESLSEPGLKKDQQRGGVGGGRAGSPQEPQALVQRQ